MPELRTVEDLLREPVAMFNCRRLSIILLALCVLGGDAWSQTSGGSRASALPGGTYRGRYIGFQPRHGRVHAQTRPPAGPASRRPGRSSTPGPVPSLSETSVGGPTHDVVPSLAVVPSAGPVDVEDMTAPLAADAFEDPVIVTEQDELHLDGSLPCATNDLCAVEPNVWVRADYLLWGIKGMSVPALATTSPSGTLQEDAGVLGLPTTSVLFGGGDLLDDTRSGARLIFGMWLDACHQTGLEISYLGLGDESAEFRGSSAGFPILARPFRDVVNNMQDARLIAFPELIEGTLAIDATSKFQSGDVMFRRPGLASCWSGVDFFVGYRYAELEDSVGITESTVSLAEPTVGTRFQLEDLFETRNRFHGGQVGVRCLGHTAPGWTLELVGKFALGNTESRTAISGQTVVTLPTGDSNTQPAGLLVQGTNRGVFETSEVSTISEFGVTLRRQLQYGWAFNVGYNFLFWTDVLRAGEQIDSGINVSQVPPGLLSGEPRPAFRALTNDVWAQGLTLGLECRY